MDKLPNALPGPWGIRPRRLATLGIAALNALVAPLFAMQGQTAALGAHTPKRSIAMRRRRRQRISFRAFSAVNQRQMVFEDVANRGQQGRHIAAVHPCAPPGRIRP